MFSHQLHAVSDQKYGRPVYPTYQTNVVDFTHGTLPGPSVSDAPEGGQIQLETSYLNLNGVQARPDIAVDHRIQRMQFNDGYEKKDDLSKLDDLIHKFNDANNWN